MPAALDCALAVTLRRADQGNVSAARRCFDILTHLQVAPLWFAAQFTFNVSLSETTVTSNTILASASSLFTYALSCLLLLEAFVISKLLFIALAIGGEHMPHVSQAISQAPAFLLSSTV